MTTNHLLDPVVQALKNRITDEDFDFDEAAQAVVDALRLRQQWTYRSLTVDMGWQEYESREQAVQETASMMPEPLLIYRVASDWAVDE